MTNGSVQHGRLDDEAVGYDDVSTTMRPSSEFCPRDIVLVVGREPVTLTGALTAAEPVQTVDGRHLKSQKIFPPCR